MNRQVNSSYKIKKQTGGYDSLLFVFSFFIMQLHNCLMYSQILRFLQNNALSVLSEAQAQVRLRMTLHQYKYDHT